MINKCFCSSLILILGSFFTCYSVQKFSTDIKDGFDLVVPEEKYRKKESFKNKLYFDLPLINNRRNTKEKNDVKFDRPFKKPFVKKRRKRNLAGTSHIFDEGRTRERPFMIPYYRSANNFLQTYAVSGGSFAFNGTANFAYEGDDSLRIFFEYVVIGNANVTIDVVRGRNVPALRYHNQPGLAALHKPKNCYLQNEEEFQVNDDKKNLFSTKHRTWKAILQNVDSTSGNDNSAGLVARKKEIFVPNNMKYKKDWFCLYPDLLFPCVAISIQAERYKISEKLCINQRIFKPTLDGRLHK